MGRAGSSGGGSSHSSGGHRSSSHGSSGHSMSNSRAGSSRSGSSSGYSGSSWSSGSYGRSYSSYGRHYSKTASDIFWIVIVLVVVVVLGNIFSNISLGSIPSTIVREKITGVQAFDTNCIEDQLNWFDYKNWAGKELKEFYDKTGVQPYIKLLDYNPSLTTDESKEKWADADFDNGGYADNAFVYYYFGEQNPDDVGYMYVCYGNKAGTVFDTEALDIFWQQLDSMWTNGDISTDDLFVKSFNNTGKKIMTVSKTASDILWIVIVLVVVVVIVVSVIATIIIKAKAAHQKREDELKILNSDINNPMM